MAVHDGKEGLIIDHLVLVPIHMIEQILLLVLGEGDDLIYVGKPSLMRDEPTSYLV